MMAEQLAALGLVQGGSAVLLGAVVWMVLTGRLVPRQVLRDCQAERDTWRQAHQVSEGAREQERGQVSELLELSRVAVRQGEVRTDATVDTEAS